MKNSRILAFMIAMVILFIGVESLIADDFSDLYLGTAYKRLLVLRNDTALTGLPATTPERVYDGEFTASPFSLSQEEMLFDTDKQLQFRSTSMYIHSDGATSLFIDGSAKLTLEATAITAKGALVPYADDTYDLGETSTPLEWQDLYIDGTAYLDAIDLNGTAITSTGAELNILDGVTADKDELNLLNGVTGELVTVQDTQTLTNKTLTNPNINEAVSLLATATELNILNGATLTTAELNLLDAGSTEAIYDSGSSVVIRTGGTSTFSFDTTALRPTGPVIDLGSSGAKFKDLYLDGTAYLDAIDLNGTLVTSTGAELNLLDAGSDEAVYDAGSQVNFRASGVEIINISEGQITPENNNTVNLGSSTFKFKDLYLDGTAYLDDASIGGDVLVTDDVSVGGELTLTGSADIATNVSLAGLLAFDGTPQILAPGSGVAGVINAETTITEYRINGANALTIADGTIEGQIKIVYCTRETDDGAGTLDGGNFAGASVTLDAVGSSIKLIWHGDSNKWYLVGAPNGGTYTVE